MAQDSAGRASSPSTVMTEHSVHRNELVNVCSYCPQRPYLELEIPSDCKEVRCIHFQIVSRDQGWCDIDKSVPTYEQSYTWFTAHVQRGGGRNDPHHETVQNNRRGNPQFAAHHITWHPNDASSSRSRWVQTLRAGDIVQLFPRAHYASWVNIVAAAAMKVTYLPRDVGLAVTPLSPSLNLPSLYEQLRKGEIRILQISPGEPDDPVYCSLIHHNLSNTEGGAFEALSYCWGDKGGDATLYLTNAQATMTAMPIQLAVAESVLGALRTLRLRNNTRRIWIDAICINQTDYNERNHQVSMMSKIYFAAVQVNVWLGEEYPGSKYAMMMVQEMYNSKHKLCSGRSKCRCESARHLLKPSAGEFLGLHEIEQVYRDEFPDFASSWDSFFSVVDALFGNPWFRRVWVLQEALLPQRVVVHCGHQQMPWTELVEIGEYMNEHLYINHAAPKAAIPSTWSTLKSAVKTQAGDCGTQPGILDIFLEALELEASDPRDKLWALLAFGNETKPKAGIRLADGIRPDYEKPTERMLADFTRWCIQEYNSLRVLSTLHGIRGRSWQSLHYPRGPAPSISRPTWAIGSAGSIKWAHATLQHRFKYRAAGDTTIDMELVKDPIDASILSLKGFKVTKIRHIGHPSIEQSVKVRPKLFEAFATLFDLARTKETWVAGKIDQLQSKGPMFDLGRRFVEHQQAHWMYGPRPLPTVIKTGDTPDTAGEIQAVEEATIPSCIEPCFFVGDDGWCGLCPSGAQCGDLAVVLLGSEVPFLLRETAMTEERVTFEFVGECYLEGAMNGEFMQAQIDKDTPPLTFSLV